MPQPFALPVGLRRAGVATRTVQAIGLEWLDDAKQSSDAVTETMRSLAAARTPGEILTIQSGFLRGAGERFATRSAAFGDLYATLAADLARPVVMPGPSRAV